MANRSRVSRSSPRTSQRRSAPFGRTALASSPATAEAAPSLSSWPTTRARWRGHPLSRSVWQSRIRPRTDSCRDYGILAQQVRRVSKHALAIASGSWVERRLYITEKLRLRKARREAAEAASRDPVHVLLTKVGHGSSAASLLTQPFLRPCEDNFTEQGMVGFCLGTAVLAIGGAAYGGIFRTGRSAKSQTCSASPMQRRWPTFSGVVAKTAK